MLDVDVQGTFPSDFQLEVRKPPTFIPTPEPNIGGPPAVLGYITAVVKDHPDVVRYADFHIGGSISGCVPTNCGEGGPCETTEACITEDMWCLEADCYRERKSCPKVNSPMEQCTILSAEGDATLKDPPLHQSRTKARLRAPSRRSSCRASERASWDRLQSRRRVRLLLRTA